VRLLVYLLLLLGPATCWSFTLLDYNASGNGVLDWSTNSAQVQAIGRQVAYLNPDIITFEEIPNSKTYEMTNFVKVWLPGYYLATNSATDGFIRSVIASRYPISRSQSWLAKSSLSSFGYSGTFTRDLFEAQVQLPGSTTPLHVFVTHLKCCSDATSVQRRAAEARAVSNFFVTVFLPTNGQHAHTLRGDLNEDIDEPPSGSGQPIQTLTSSATGLHLTTPLNPYTNDKLTWSLRSPPLTIRFDYILPCGLLFSNIVSSQSFRTDLLPNPPPPLQGSDSATASDHLPVFMSFNYPDPPARIVPTLDTQGLRLNWPSLLGRRFTVESSSGLADWTTVISNLPATTTNCGLTLGTTNGQRFFRVIRVP
jgi:endonuclease/exonuclease/phosphatase family metal-dependent hydrolase